MPVKESTTLASVAAERVTTSLLSEFELCTDTESLQGTSLDEISTYLSYGPPVPGQNVLEFWKLQEKQLPRLTQFSREILGIQASSISSERLFSNAGNILTEKRTNLSAEKLDDLLFLMWNNSPENSVSVE